MEVPLTIRYTDFAPSGFIDGAIQKRVDRLERFYRPIISCHVTVAAPHQGKNKGTIFQIKIYLKVPRAELMVDREPEKNRAHEDVYVAIRDAFDALEGKLRKHHGLKRESRRLHHESPPHGEVVKIFHGEGYGFIRGADGRDIYFHQNSVLEGFDSINVGDLVRYREEKGDHGPQASSLTRIGG